MVLKETADRAVTGAALYEYFDFDLESATFEWDEEKDRINFQRHGIHFKTAMRVFLDPNKLIREDEEHPSEQRYDIRARSAAYYSSSAPSARRTWCA